MAAPSSLRTSIAEMQAKTHRSSNVKEAESPMVKTWRFRDSERGKAASLFGGLNTFSVTHRRVGGAPKDEFSPDKVRGKEHG